MALEAEESRRIITWAFPRFLASWLWISESRETLDDPNEEADELFKTKTSGRRQTTEDEGEVEPCSKRCTASLMAEPSNSTKFSASLRGKRWTEGVPRREKGGRHFDCPRFEGRGYVLGLAGASGWCVCFASASGRCGCRYEPDARARPV